MARNKIIEKIDGIHYMDSMAEKNSIFNKLNPLAKLIVTICYILTVVSFDKYDFSGLFVMVIYIISISILGDISLRRGIRQLKGVMLIVSLVGIANPFFDKVELLRIGNIVITGGVISMITLMVKGVMSVLASYLLLCTTSIEEICCALKNLHIPKGIVITILLMYRYIIVLLKEVDRMLQAYKLRAPREKGINIKVWGSFVGQLLLRSIDRAQVVYDSMLLRGFDGEFIDARYEYKRIKSILYVLIWISIFISIRCFNISETIGKIFV